MFRSVYGICCPCSWLNTLNYNSCHTTQVDTQNILHFVCDICILYRRRGRECHTRCHKHRIFYILYCIKMTILHKRLSKTCKTVFSLLTLLFVGRYIYHNIKYKTKSINISPPCFFKAIYSVFYFFFQSCSVKNMTVL